MVVGNEQCIAMTKAIHKTNVTTAKALTSRKPILSFEPATN
jgi:hypothetical protein